MTSYSRVELSGFQQVAYFKSSHMVQSDVNEVSCLSCYCVTNGKV